MEKHIQKISHKYEFLKLELEERQEVLDGYLSKWNSVVGKYFLDKQKVMYINEETGEIRQDIPEKEPLPPADPKLKKLYRKLSTFAHPDKGGNTEDFNILKTAYEERDIIAIIKFAVKYGVKVKLEKGDSEIIERKINSFNDKIQTIENSLIWQYFKGDLETKKLVIQELQNTHNIKLTEKDIEDFLSI